MIDIRSLRKARGLTQTELAALLEVGQARMARIEARPDAVSLGQVAQILDVLGGRVAVSLESNWSAPEKPLQSFVYVIPHRGLPALKIGKANDVDLRAAMLGDIDVEAGIYLIGDSERKALSAESLLHKAFRKWRLHQDLARQIGIEHDGSTEWFDISCMPRVRRFIKANADLIGLELCDAPIGRG